MTITSAQLLLYFGALIILFLTIFKKSKPYIFSYVFTAIIY